MNNRLMKVNQLYFGDNIEVMRIHIQDECVDLIYLDPPFNSKKDYNLIFSDEAGERSTSQVQAFEDSWGWGEASEKAFEYLTDSAMNHGRVPTQVSRLVGAMRKGLGDSDVLAYIVMMTERLLELHRALKRTGSIYLHCDPAASHYLKIVMDAIFGPRNFRREVVWRSGWVSGFKAAAKNWVRNHDILLYYVKDHEENFTFNKDKAYVPHEKGYKRRGGGENPKGVAIEDVWSDIYSPWIMSFSKEKLGWPTQKPRALLKRIIEVSSSVGDLVLDPFCGCGTALVAAQELGRKWIGIDITPLAIAVMKSRLDEEFGLRDIPVEGEPADIEGARALAAEKDGGYKFQWWAVGRIGARPVSDAQKKKGGDRGIDGEMTFLADHASDVQRILISAKSGHVTPAMVRELRGTIEREDAAIGILVTLNEPTREMEREAVRAGWYKNAMWDKKFRRLQIVTAEQLIHGVRPDLPSGAKSGMPLSSRVIAREDPAQLGLAVAEAPPPPYLTDADAPEDE